MSGLPPIKLSFADNNHVNRCLARVPHELRRSFKGNYAVQAHEESLKAANLHLLDVKAMADSKYMTLDYEEIKTLAEYRANLCLSMTADGGSAFAKSCGIDAPYSKHEKSVYLRLINPKWWRRKLLTRSKRDRELFSIQAGFVHKLASPYCSQIAFEQIRKQDELNQELMKQIKLVSGDGDELTLFDAWKSSTSNPYNRFVELVTRIKGFEAYAESKGHEAMFLTITAPSKYHAYLSAGYKNPKYRNASPRDTHKHLMQIWAKVRAQLAKQNIEIYGLRIVEPHHDATPHYHAVIFGESGQLEQAVSIMRDYFTAEDKHELKNDSVRFDAKNIDSSKGSAVGYVIKYLAKNIVNESVNLKAGEDHETDTPISETSHKVVAWARVWGIRQFTFFGGAGVSVWRELRRIEKPLGDALLEELRIHARNSDWFQYQTLMESLDVTPYYLEAFNPDTGELITNAYQETITRIKGIESDSGTIITRVKEWRVVMPNQSTNQGS